MVTMPYRIAAYFILFIGIGITGALFAKLTEYSGMSQYMSNFIYAVININFIIENWALKLDLDEQTELLNISMFS